MLTKQKSNLRFTGNSVNLLGTQFQLKSSAGSQLSKCALLWKNTSGVQIQYKSGDYLQRCVMILPKKNMDQETYCILNLTTKLHVAKPPRSTLGPGRTDFQPKPLEIYQV